MAGRGRNIGARVLFSYDRRPLGTFDIKPGYRALAGTMGPKHHPSSYYIRASSFIFGQTSSHFM
jgi:hypothetical protein